MSIWIDNGRTYAPWNVACDEFLLTQKTETAGMLWRNARSVIIGRNQDLKSEVNLEFCRENDIDVVRRVSGGGAVFHDLGNVNYSFASEGTSGFAEFARPLISALAELGVTSELSGRNDILVDGRKVSGCAHARHKNRSLFHGTLLFSADVSAMAGALLAGTEKLKSKGIASVPARVANLSEFLPGMTVEEFMSKIRESLLASGKFSLYTMTESDVASVDKLTSEKFANDAWTDGTLRGTKKVGGIRRASGSLEAWISVENGKIKAARFTGDFFGTVSVENLEAALAGCEYTRSGVSEHLKNLPLSDILHGFVAEDVLAVIFGK